MRSSRPKRARVQWRWRGNAAFATSAVALLALAFFLTAGPVRAQSSSYSSGRAASPLPGDAGPPLALSRQTTQEIWKPAAILVRGGRVREALPALRALERRYATRAGLGDALDEDPESLWMVAVALTNAGEAELAVAYASAFSLGAVPIAAATDVNKPRSFEAIVGANLNSLWTVTDSLARWGYGPLALKYLKEFERRANDPAFTGVFDRDPSSLWRPPASSDPEIPAIYERLKDAYRAAKDKKFGDVFPVPAKNPAELWDNADFLLRSGDVGGALIHFERFAATADDAALTRVIGPNPAQMLKLLDHPALGPVYGQLRTAYSAARRKQLSNPASIRRSLPPLLRSEEERRFAIEDLKAFGPYAVPVLLKAIRDEKDAGNRRLLTESLAKLDPAIVPALIGGLEGPDVSAAAAAEALGAMGSSGRSALPFLIYPAAQSEKPALNAKANQTLKALANVRRPDDPAQALTQEAERYLAGRVPLGSGPVAVWSWPSDLADGPKPDEVPVPRAEEIWGTRLAGQALKLNPFHKPAQLVLWTIKLDKAVERAGSAAFLAKPPAEVADALAPLTAAGPEACRDLLRLAMSHRMAGTAALAAQALGRTLPRDRFLGDPKHWGLIQGLTVPDARVQFASAKALAEIEPNRPFAGSSDVAKTLGRFMTASPTSKAVVLSGDIRRANELAMLLTPAGYVVSAFDRAEDAFDSASSSAYVELIVIDALYPLKGSYDLRDAFKNFRADARTAGIPILMPGTLLQTDRLLDVYARRQPLTASVIYSADPAQFVNQVERALRELNAPPRLSEQERREYSGTAARLVAKIAKTADSPYRPDVDQDVWPLVRASYGGGAALETVSALADVPSVDAQRRLADLALESSRPEEERVRWVNDLARGIRRHGSLLLDDQERELLFARTNAPDGPLKQALSAAVDAMTPPPLVPVAPKPGVGAAAPKPSLPNSLPDSLGH